MEIPKHKITFYGIIAGIAFAVGLWGRSILREEPEHVDITAYRVYDGGTAYKDTTSGKPFIPNSWLGRKARRADLEALLKDTLAQPVRGPKGQIIRDAFAEEINFVLTTERPSDRYRHFRSPRQSWADMAGREGIALVRDGVPITGVVTILN